jgi:hypothetical protein
MKTLAQIEPRIAIAGGGGATVSAPGSYFLTGNITVAAGNGINITANNVTLDLGGFTISSTAVTGPLSGTGIALASALTNITIVNGFIYGAVTNNGAAAYGGTGFSSGIYYTGSQPVNVRVSNVSISGCYYNGIYINASIGGTGNTVEDCLVNNCGGFGISAEIVLDSIAYAGAGSAVFSGTASRSRGVSYSSEGLHAAASAENCSGQSTSNYGINAVNARKCYGLSTSSYGINSGDHTDTSYGQTGTGLCAISAGLTADNSYGNHTGGGGTGLSSAQLAIGCYGTSGAAGSVGIHSGILNCCLGSAVGGTSATFSFKYNMP